MWGHAMTLVHVMRMGHGGAESAQPFGLRGWRYRRRCERDDQVLAQWMVAQLHGAFYEAGLATDTTSCAGLPGVRGPTVTSVRMGPAPHVSIRPLPGQLLGDYQAAAARLAAALHVAQVRLTRRPNGLIRCHLVKVDPLRTPVAQPIRPESSVHDPVVLGMVESGERLSVSLVDIAHIVVQGRTRSGKSRFVYSLLAQLAGRDDLLIAGSDNTSILLRPFTGSRHAQYQVLGSDQLEHHVILLEGLVEKMQLRVAAIPPRADALPITVADPLVLVVVEEYPVLLDLLGAHDAQHRTKLQARFKGAVRSLLAGGAKAGMRVLLIVQRADATGPAAIGSFERGQCAVRASFAVDTHDAAKMLHPAITKEAAEEHATSPPGIALLSAPEIPLARLRSPTMPDYGTYADLVAAALASSQL
jgi:hypothetical protein